MAEDFSFRSTCIQVDTDKDED